MKKHHKVKVFYSRETNQIGTQFKLSNYNWKLIIILEILLQIVPPADTPVTVNHKSKSNHNILVVAVNSSQKIFERIIILEIFAAPSYFQFIKGKSLKRS